MTAYGRTKSHCLPTDVARGDPDWILNGDGRASPFIRKDFNNSMNLTPRLLRAFPIAAGLAFALPMGAYQAPPAQAFGAAGSAPVPTSGLWRDRGNIASLNLLYGPGGKEHVPAGKFTFVKEDKNGT